MENKKETCVRIFALSFLIEDPRDTIEYRLTPNDFGYRLDRRIHDGSGTRDIRVDWGTSSYYPDLRSAIREIFQLLRTLEIENGLYKGLRGSKLPFDIYAQKIDQWADYADRLNFRHFTIHGNDFKYLPRPSPETKAFSLRLYESLIDQCRTPSATDLWLEELIKREISNLNEYHFCREEFKAMQLSAFLKRHYPDFDDQIDRYLLHQKPEDRMAIVTPENRKQVIDNFEHFVLPKFDDLRIH